jgi:tetratricopeptide (TPR) repeat protein
MKSDETLGPSLHSVAAAVAGENTARRFADALVLVDRALEQNPNDADLLVARASTLFEWGRVIEARDTLLRARAIGANGADVSVKLGWCFVATGRKGEALQCMVAAAAGDPDSAAAHFGLATAFYNNGRGSDAQGHLEFVLAREPKHFESLIQLGELKLASNEPIVAEALFRRAIDCEPHNPAGWLTLGMALDRQGRSHEAVEAVEMAQRVEEQSGIDIENFVNLAVVYSDAGRFDEARQVLEVNLLQKPSPRAHTAYAFLLLRLGLLREGWEHYEFRLMQHGVLDRIPHQRPPWVGQPLQGRTILLWREQGVGDAIQFVRFAPMLKALGATVWLQIGAAVQELASRFPGVDRVFADGKPVPDFDYYVHLASLPLLFSTDADTVPAEVPYVFASSRHLEKWKRRLDKVSGLKVGLVWAGHPNHLRDWERSIALEKLLPMASVENVSLFSLQIGPASAELASFAGSIEDLSRELIDFSDTAAALQHLDLIVSVDTSVAHLAGAMARPTWLLLPKGCDFRWMEGRTDSPWYPTMRLFRQTRRGDWGEVIARVSEELRRLVHLSERQEAVPGQLQLQIPRGVAPAVPARLATASTEQLGKIAVAEVRYGVVQYIREEPQIGQSIGWYGEYLHEELLALLELVKPGATIIETAAGIGLHALALAAAVGESGHVMLYESRPLHRRLLAQNLAANGATNITLMRRPMGGEGHKQGERIDDLRLERLDAIKINQALLPLDILSGAEESMWRLRPIAMLCDVQKAQALLLAGFVRDFGYRCSEMVAKLFNPGNFYRRQRDVFCGQNATTLLCIPEELNVSIKAEGFQEIS